MATEGIRQNFSSKSDTIHSLAAAFGAETNGPRISMATKYDKATGTYYCHGKMYSKMIIEQAKQYMYTQAQKYSKMGGEYADLSMAYDLSYEALCTVTEGTPKEKSGSK